VVTAAAVELSLRQRAELDAIFDARQAAVVSAWDAAWGSVADEVIAYADAWAEAVGEFARFSSIPYARRVNLEQSIDHIASRLANTNTATAQQTLKALELVTPRAEADTAALALAQSGAVPWLPTDPAAVDAIVQRSTQQITVRSYVLSREGTAAMKSALRVGVAAGDNPRRIARQMVKTTEGVFNGGLARAEVIARTEVMDAYRAAAHETMRANADVLAGWTWLCELSDRTCPSCLAMDGTLHSLDEPGPNDHHQGRCTSIPALKTRKDLGLPGPEPKDAKRDAVGWLKQQPESVQRNVLGPKGYPAWKAGKFPPSKWAQRVESPEWRPAYHTAKPPEPKPPRAPRQPSAPPQASRPTPAKAYTIDGLTDDEADALMADLADRGDWAGAERVSEQIDARLAGRPQPWKADIHDPYNEQTYTWFDNLTEDEQFAFLDRLPSDSRFSEQQWAWKNEATVPVRGSIPPERQIRAEWDAYLDRAWIELEDATRGTTLTREAQAAGRRTRDLLRVNPTTARKWASEEVLRYWDENGRLTYEAFKAGYTRSRSAVESAAKTYWA
jgi:SPP1 gp7 family putative phage head morphogenesis protein